MFGTLYGHSNFNSVDIMDFNLLFHAFTCSQRLYFCYTFSNVLSGLHFERNFFLARTCSRCFGTPFYFVVLAGILAVARGEWFKIFRLS